MLLTFSVIGTIISVSVALECFCNGQTSKSLMFQEKTRFEEFGGDPLTWKSVRKCHRDATCELTVSCPNCQPACFTAIVIHEKLLEGGDISLGCGIFNPYEKLIQNRSTTDGKVTIHYCSENRCNNPFGKGIYSNPPGVLPTCTNLIDCVPCPPTWMLCRQRKLRYLTCKALNDGS